MSVCADGRGAGKPPKCRRRLGAITKHSHASAEVVSVIENVEAFHPQQQARSLTQLDPLFNEDGHFRGKCAAKSRLIDHYSVNNGPVIRQAITVIIYARRRIERSR